MSINGALTDSATKHTEWMAKQNKLSHEGQDGSTPTERIKAAGYVKGDADYGSGENIASGYHTAEAVVAAWMASPGHRANILNGQFEEIGIAVAYNQYGEPYYTQNFGFGGKPEFVTPGFRVAPVRFNDYGANGDFQRMDYALDSSVGFPAAFEVSQHIGVITELWPSNVTPLRDAAKIDIDGMGENGEPRSFDFVDIFYHCEGSATVEGGMSAFQPGDEVLVLNEGGKPHPTEDDLVIVGFKDGLKLCSYGIKVASVNGSSNYTRTGCVVRLTQPIPTVVELKGGYTEEYRVVWEGNLDANGVAIINDQEMEYPIDPDKPLHVWFRRSALFQYFTEATVGDYPDVVVCPGEIEGTRHDIGSLVEWEAIQEEPWFNQALILDRVWGQQLGELMSVDLRQIEKITVTAENGKTFPAWVVDFAGIKVIRAADSQILIASSCGPNNSESQLIAKDVLMIDQFTNYPTGWDYFICGGWSEGVYWIYEPCNWCINAAASGDYSLTAPGFGVRTDKFGRDPVFQNGQQECIVAIQTQHYMASWDPVQGECGEEYSLTPTGEIYSEHIRSWTMTDAQQFL